MGVFDRDTFAYLTRRPTNHSDGIKHAPSELGVCAYGPGGEELADRVAKRIRAWEHDRQSMTELWIEVHPADTGDELSGQLDIRKRHTRVIVRTALLADDLSTG
jgi:protein-L-isoaspartate(D-aspartate) O-methyltransferase